MKHQGRRSLAALVAALFFTGCAGASLPRGPGAEPSDRHTASAHFTISIPPKSRERRARGKRPHYISPNTMSMSISIASSSGGGPVVLEPVNLTPDSNGCTTVSNVTQCSFTVALAPGHYLATVDTYDALNEGGNLLSRGQRLPMTVQPGVANNVGLTLGGVPHSLQIGAGTGNIAGTQAAGFTVAGVAPIVITAKDADGNTIVGAGTPFTGSVVSGSGWSIQSAPATQSPNELAITPGAKNSNATLKVTVNYDAATCALAGVVCSATFSATSQLIQYLFVADCEINCNQSSNPDAVLVYAPPYTGAPVATITTGIFNPVSLAIDGSGRVYVANCVTCWVTHPDTVTVYAPPFSDSSAPVTTVAFGVSHPTKILLNSSGDLFVAGCTQPCTGIVLNRYQAPLTDDSAPANALTNAWDGFVAMTMDSKDNLLVANCSASCSGSTPDSLLAYAPPNYSGTPVSVTNGIPDPMSLGVDGSGHVFVGGTLTCTLPPCGLSQVTAYAAPYTSTSAPIATLANGINFPEAMTVDSSGNLYVANGGALDVTEYPAPGFSDASPTTLFGSSGYSGSGIAIDQAGNLFMTGTQGNARRVVLSVPPYSGLTPIAPGLSLPSPIAITP
jgi:hypothetical protein